MNDAQRPFDISFVLNTHAGRNYLARTMRSLEAASRHAREAALRIELLFVLDRSPPATRDWVSGYRSPDFDAIRTIAVDNGSLGPSRQDGLEAAAGTYVMYCDDDDLVSPNMALACHRVAEAQGPDTIVIPEFLFGFGAQYFLAHYDGTDVISPLAFLAYHPFVSRLFVHRGIRHRLRYRDVRLDTGYAYEDWHYNADAVAAGFAFRTAPDTILFYRQRRSGLLQSANALSVRQTPPSRLFEPTTFLRVCGPSYRRFQLAPRPAVDTEAIRRRFLAGPATRQALREVAAIEPAVVPWSFAEMPIPSNRYGDLWLGAAYFRACRTVGPERFTDVVLTTDLGPASLERSALDVVSALADRRPETRTLILLDRRGGAAEPSNQRPRNAVIVDLFALDSGLSDDQIDTLALRLVEATAAKARLHLSSGSFPNRFFRKFRAVLGGMDRVFHRAEAPTRRLGPERLRYGAGFDLLSDCLEDIDLILTDSEAAIRYDRARLDRSPEKWRRLYRLRREGPFVPNRDAGRQGILMLRPSPGLGALLPDRLGGPAVDVVAELSSDLALGAYEALLVPQADLADYAEVSAALAAGLAVIAPADGAAAEAVVDGKNGFLFRPADGPAETAARIAEAVDRLYADPRVLAGFARRSRELFAARHGPGAFAAAVAALFGEQSGAPERGCHPVRRTV